MAKIGYIFISKNLSSRDEDIVWMKTFGCCDIIEEDGCHEKLRPQWRKMLTQLQPGDEIVVSKLSNALRGTRELGIFLSLCREYKIRVVSIHDEIDSNDELFPGSTAGRVLDTISRFSAETTSLRRVEARALKVKKRQKSPLKEGIRRDREKTIINMYNAGYSIKDIWEVSGYVSRTSVFRVLNRNGVKLNRGRHQGPIKKRAVTKEN